MSHDDYSNNEPDPELRAFRESMVRKFHDARFAEIAGLFLAIALIVLGVIGACIYWGQLREMRRSNELTRQSIHGSQRAWVGLRGISPVSLERVGDAHGPTFLLTVNFGLRNYGHSAAQHVRIFPQLDPFDVSVGSSEACNDSNPGVYVGDIVFPEQDRGVPYGVSIPVAKMETAVKGQNAAMGRKLILILRGCIEYIDDPAEKTPHHTPFSYFVTRTDPERFFTPDLQKVPGDKIVLQANTVYTGNAD